MQLLYNSDTFAVVLFGAEAGVPGAEAGVPGADAKSAQSAQPAPSIPSASATEPILAPHGGYEIVDKTSRKEIYLQGPVAASFQRGVKALVEQGPDPQALEDFIASFTVLAQHPVVLH